MITGITKGARVLLTGCTGFVGKVVLEELMRRREELKIERVYLLIRPRKHKSPRERFEQDVATSPCFSRLKGNWRELCEPIAGDMKHEGLGISPGDTQRLQDELTHVLHCAASVDFGLPIADATEINITGALRVLSFGQQCPKLERLIQVSTAYVTPHPGDGVPVEEKLVNLPFDAEEVYATIKSGRADEKALLAQTGHANTYTFTKCIAEVMISRRRGNTPVTIVRPSIVSACRRYPFAGWIDSRAAYAGFVAMLGAGHLKVVRVDPNSVLDVIPCDDVADRIISCAFDPALQKEPFMLRHAVAGLANSGLVSKLAYSHERFFRAHPHDKEARWAYLGDSEGAFRFNEWVYHYVPVQAAKIAMRLTKQEKAERQIDRVAYVLRYLNEAFYYFVSHTFDFRTAFPPLEGFDLDSYLESVSHGISEHLLKRNPREAPLRMHGTDIGWAMKQPQGNWTSRAFAYFLRKVLRGAQVEITFSEAEIKAAAAQAREGDLIVLAPSHRSYMDFLVTSLLCFAHPGLGLKLPRVAATDDFSKIPIVGPILRRAGAFYIRRGLGRADPQLTKQIIELIDQGHSLSFYVEGARSRSRRYLQPKRGILRALQQSGRPAVVMPLSISYDRVAEEEGFLKELQGYGKHTGGLLPLGGWLVKLIRGRIKLGRIHIRGGAPLRLDADSDVRELSRQIVAQLQRHSAVTTFHLRSFLRRYGALGIEQAALRSAITSRGGLVLESKLNGNQDVPALLDRTFAGQWMHLFYEDVRSRAGDNPAIASHLSRNGFWFPQGKGRDDAVTDMILDALFEPVCRDYQAAAAVVDDLVVGEWFTAQDVVRRAPGSFLPDMEGALDDLAERGALESAEGKYRRIEGSSLNLSDYRSACAWVPSARRHRMVS
jgi:thioester reductase-like protein/1-acyl-sn-glycerol-3-phosphate acyltransferase